MNFIEKCVSGQIKDPINEIDDYVDKWHNGDGWPSGKFKGTRVEYPKIYEYLGMTQQEYFSWLEDANNLNEIIRKREIWLN